LKLFLQYTPIVTHKGLKMKEQNLEIPNGDQTMRRPQKLFTFLGIHVYI